MNDSTVIARAISEIKDTQVATAEAAMLQQFDPIQAAVNVGKYRGLLAALDTIDAILRDDVEKETPS